MNPVQTALVPAPTVLALDELARVKGYLDAGIAKSTRRAYAASWATWTTWCAARGVPGQSRPEARDPAAA